MDFQDEALFGTGFDPAADGYPTEVVFGNWCDNVPNCTVHQIPGGVAYSRNVKIQDDLWVFHFGNGSTGACSPAPPTDFVGGYSISDGLYVGEQQSQSGLPGSADLTLQGGTLESRFGHLVSLSGQRSVGAVRLGPAPSRWFATEYVRVGVSQNPLGNPDTLHIMSGSKVLVGTLLDVRQSGRVFLDGGGMHVGSLEDDGGPLDFMVIHPTGTVSGNGVIDGILAITCDGTIAPGASPGTLTINGDITMSEESRLNIELGGTLPGEFDQLLVTGHATVGGTVSVLFVDGFAPSVGDTFPFLQFGTQEGAFSDVVMPPGYSASCGCDGKAFSIVVTSANPSVPAASTWTLFAMTMLLLTTGAIVLRRSGGGAVGCLP